MRFFYMFLFFSFLVLPLRNFGAPLFREFLSCKRLRPPPTRWLTGHLSVSSLFPNCECILWFSPLHRPGVGKRADTDLESAVLHSIRETASLPSSLPSRALFDS